MSRQRPDTVELDDIVYYTGVDTSNRSIWYVVFGQKKGNPWATPWPNPFDPTPFTGSIGFSIIDVTSDVFYGLAAVFADLNDDGIKDLALGANPHGGSGKGSVDVVFGRVHGNTWPTTFNMSSPPAGCCTIIWGITAGDNTGKTTAVGDFNGDGLDDLLIGAPGASPNGITKAGSAFIVYGAAASWPSSFDLSGLNGSNGIRLDGATASQAVGSSLGSGDVNNDGVSDILVGNPNATVNGNTNAGISYVLFGKKQTWSTPYNLGGL